MEMILKIAWLKAQLRQYFLLGPNKKYTPREEAIYQLGYDDCVARIAASSKLPTTAEELIMTKRQLDAVVVLVEELVASEAKLQGELDRLRGDTEKEPVF